MLPCLDGSLDPRQLPRLVDPVPDGTADLVLGARQPASGVRPVLHARTANLALALVLRRRGWLWPMAG